MKPDKLKKLFRVKRIVALALAAAMTVTSVPQTAYAAEAGTVETETAEQETTVEADVQQEAEQAVQSSIPVEATEQEETETNESETLAEAGTQTAGEKDVKEAENQAEGDTTPAENSYKLENKLENDAKLKTAVYNGSAPFTDRGNTPGYDILSKLEVLENGELIGNLYDYSSNFVYKWQKEGTDSKAPDTDPALIPNNAGSYQLVITPESDSVFAKAEPITITGFTIHKADTELTFELSDIKPGTAKDKVKDSITDVCIWANGNIAFMYDPEDENTELKITSVIVTDPFKTDENNETSDTYLKKNGDYAVRVTVDFSDKATDEQKGNYNLPQSYVKPITVADLKETTTKLEGVTGAVEAKRSDNGASVKIINKTYGDEISVPSYTSVKVEEAEPVIDKDGNEQYTAVTPKEGEVSGKWHSAEFRSWTETKKVPEKNEDGTEKKDENGRTVYKNQTETLCSLTVGSALEEGSMPKEAGAYVYRVTYAGDKEQHASSYADIVVEIAAAEVTVKPVLADSSAKFYANETVRNVLTKITWSPDKGDLENIWGTSYDSDNKTQPYEPVFGVYRIEKEKAVLLNNTDKLTVAEGVTYEVRFTGKKAVRNANGAISESYQKDINDDTVDSYNGNYKTKTDMDTLAANRLVIEFNASDVKIDTTPITGDAALAAAGLKKSEYTIDGNTIYTKVYKEDGALYDSRAAYKTVTAGSGESLTYKWYQWYGTYEKNDAYYDVRKAYVAVLNGELSFKNNWHSLAVNHNDFNSVKNCLSNAGIYKLEITYDDGTAYAQENIYYAIERQQLRLVPTNVPAAHYGIDTWEYVQNNKSQFQPKLQMRPENTGDIWTDMDWTQDRTSGDYYLDSGSDWYVEAKAPTPAQEGEQPEWDGWQEAGSFELRIGEADQTVEQNKYRIAFSEYSIIINNSRHNAVNYTFEEYSVVDVKTENEGEQSKPAKKIVSENLSTAEIAVSKAGEKELTLKLPEKEIKAEKIYDNTPITVDLSGVKYMDSEGKEVTPQFIWLWVNDDLDIGGVPVSPEEAVNAGSYTICAKYDGDENYTPVQWVEVATAVIEKAELTVAVKPLAEEVSAGTYAYEVYEAYRDNKKDGDILTVTGFPEKETQEVKDAFTQWKQIGRSEGQLMYCYPAWTQIYNEDGWTSYDCYAPELYINGSDNEIYYDRLKSGEKYTLNVGAEWSEPASPYRGNYKLKAGAPVEITVAYASAEVALSSYGGSSLKAIDKMTKGESAEKFTHDVTFRSSIPYAPFVVTENGVQKTVYGSWAVVTIIPPKEYDNAVPETAVYENALKNAGAASVYERDGKINAVFNLSKDTENGLEPNPVTFLVAWKEGFVEKFTITPEQENLAADLRNAVAPKSVAFNAPKTKMVVGEVQDLDVKITKVQNEDLVYLDYRITEGADVLAISSQGRVTALKEGNATVEVYPVRIENNEKKEITGVKTGQVKITVSKVAAPKVGKLMPADVSVDVQYPYVKNNGRYYDYGYRREVYVMPGSKKTAVEFDAAIKKFEETGDYKTAGLATTPVYISNAIEKQIAEELARGTCTKYEYDENISGLASGKNVTMQITVGGLTPKTEYCIYVRNVSASRTVLDKDGNKKTVELSSNGTPKDFKTTLGQVKKLVVTSEGEAKTAVLYAYDENEGESISRNVPFYEYELTSGGAQLAVTGLFSAVEDGVDQAEKPDLSNGYIVPFTGADKAALKSKLLEPKLEYRMYQVAQEDDGRWSYITHDYYDEAEDYWVDKGEYYYYSGCLNAAQYTKADKKGKLKFAQPEALAVTVYDTVTKTESAPIIIQIKADADSAAGKSVTLQVGQKTPVVDLVAYKAGRNALDSGNPYFTHAATAADSDYLKVDENGNITPVKFEKSAAKQTVTVTASEGTSVSGASTVTIKELEPIKGLKFSNLIDNSFMLDFAPSIYAEGYIVDIKSSAGNLVQRKYISQRDEYLDYNDGYIWYYSAKKKAYTWQPRYMERFRITGLTAKSKYNVTVTAVYGDEKSKAVSKAVTMTKLPAWDEGIANDRVDAGMPIWVFANGEIDNSAESYAFVSGNRYTLVAGANQGAQYAVTDKLTWTSSDSKVAKVSAVGGTYSASLKALKAGTTTIEVKSGILKQTIARWTITVRSVGDAYNSAYFYDENEDLRGDGTDRYDTKEKLVLNVPMTVELAAGAKQSFKFTAEEAGNYKAVVSEPMKQSVSVSGSLSNMTKGATRTVTVTVSGNEPVSGTITVEKVPGTDFAERTPIKLNEKLSVPASGWAVFTAEKDGLYRFNGSSSVSLYVDQNGSLTSLNKSDYTIDYAMKAQDTVYIKNNSAYNNDISVSSVSLLLLKTGEQYSVESYNTYWYTFTAEQDGDYRFKAQSRYVSFIVYKDYDAINNGITLGTTCTMKAGDTLYVQVYAGQYSETTFEVKKVEPVIITDDKIQYPGSAEAGAITRYSLTPSADAVYTFTLDSSARSIGIYLEGSEETELKSETWTRTVSYPLKAGTAYSIMVDNTDNSYDLSLTVNKIVINALTVDGGAVTFSVPTGSSGRYGWVSFTVPQDGEGFYEFTLTKTGSGYRYIYVTGELTEDTREYISQIYMSSSSATKELYLSAGQKLYLLANGNSLPSDVSVAVKKAGRTIQPFPTEAVTVAAGEMAWFSYQVESDGRYSFTSSHTGGYAYSNCYEDVNKDYTTENERYWKAGSTVYVKVMNNTSTDAVVTLKANKIEPTVWMDADVSQTVPGNNEEKWFAFTAPEEAEYTFTCKMTNNNLSYFYLYSEKQFQSESYSNGISGNSVTYPFAQGETVYIKTNSYMEAVLSAEKAGFQELNDGENEVTSEGNNTIVKFTAPETGIYTFISDQSNGYLYFYADKEAYVMSQDSQYVSGGSGNPICYPLIKDTTVYLKIYCYSIGNESAESYNLTVSRDESVEMEEVKIGENTLTLTADDKWIYCTVTDNETDNLYISYTSEDNKLNSISYQYVYSYRNYNWQSNSISWSRMYNNSSGDIVSVVNNLMLVKLTPYNSGKITLKISKDSN